MSLGFVKQSLNAVVDGVVESIKIAHDHMKLGHLAINQGFVYDANINRSPWAYLNNPEEERKKWAQRLIRTYKNYVKFVLMLSFVKYVNDISWI